MCSSETSVPQHHVVLGGPIHGFSTAYNVCLIKEVESGSYCCELLLADFVDRDDFKLIHECLSQLNSAEVPSQELACPLGNLFSLIRSKAGFRPVVEPAGVSNLTRWVNLFEQIAQNPTSFVENQV